MEGGCTRNERASSCDKIVIEINYLSYFYHISITGCSITASYLDKCNEIIVQRMLGILFSYL